MGNNNSQGGSKALAITIGVLLVIAGALAIVVPVLAGVAVTAIVAWMLMLGAVLHFVWAWHRRGFGGVLWQALLGVLYAAVSGYLLVHPLRGLESLTLLLAIFLFIESGIEFVLGFELRGLHGAGWILVDAGVTLVLAGLILAAWPFDTGWAIGTLVGINLIFSGGSSLMLALAHGESAVSARAAALRR